MPKYIVAGSQFNPFTYDELVRPIQEAAKAHRETDDALSMLAMQAGSIGSRIGSGEENAIAAKMYDNYMSTVKSAADDLYKNGYNSVTARALSNARAMYATDIAKLDAAIKNRDARIKEYNDILRSDDTVISEYDPSSRGLDNWLADDNFGYFRKMSGKTLMDLGKKAGESLKGRFLTKSGFKAAPGTGGYLLEQLTRTGITPEQIDRAVMNIYTGSYSDDAGVNAAQNAIMEIYNSSGMDSWTDEQGKIKAINYIAQGLGSAVGDIKSEHTANEAAKQAAANMRLAAQLSAKRSTVSRSGSGSDEGEAYIPAAYNESVQAQNMRKVSRRDSRFNAAAPLVVKGAKGNVFSFRTEDEAEEYLTQVPLRRKASEELGGIDVGGKNLKGLTGVVGNLKIEIKKDKDGYFVSKEKFPGSDLYYDEELTKKLKYYKNQHDERRDEIERNNPGLKIDKLSTSAKAERKYDKWSGADTEIGDARSGYLNTTWAGDKSGWYVAGPGDQGKAMREVILSNVAEHISGNGKRDNSRAGYAVKVGKRGSIGFTDVKNRDLDKLLDPDNILSLAIDGESIVNGGVKAITKDGDKVIIPAGMIGGQVAAEFNDPNYLMLMEAYDNASSFAQKQIEEGELARYALGMASRIPQYYLRTTQFKAGSKTSAKPIDYGADTYFDDYIETYED